MLTPAIQEGFQVGVSKRASLAGVRTELAGDGENSPWVLVTSTSDLHETLLDECFGPVVVIVRYDDEAQLKEALERVPGSLTATIHCGENDKLAAEIALRLVDRVGRIVFNGYPTGVAVTWAMQHGGPYPSSTFPHHTSVGASAIRRFLRPVSYQDAPEVLLPMELREDNPLGLPRRVDGRYVPGTNASC